MKTCRVCGCHDLMACEHPNHGNCSWAKPTAEGPICSHCQHNYPDVDRPWQMPRFMVDWRWKGGDRVHKYDYRTTSAEQAQELFWNSSVAPYHLDKMEVVEVRQVPRFLAQTVEQPGLTWWEERAIELSLDRANLHPADLETLDELGSGCVDDFEEVMARDGEPGPRAGTIAYRLNAAQTELTIRSTKRALVIITLEQLNTTT